jgi:3-oxoacyl-[acyl-carrier protein] reductase
VDKLLDGRVAIVTGGGSGIGAAVCELFGGEGATVVVLDRDADRAHAVAARVARSEALVVDVTDSSAVDAAFADVVERHGSISVLANVAGVDDPETKHVAAQQRLHGKPMSITAAMSDATWHRLLSINLDGTFYALRAAVRAMTHSGGGSIINLSSVGGTAGVAGQPHYSASKAAVIGLTQSVAKEVADQGIRVNAIAPGPVDTPMFARTIATQGAPKLPMGRLAKPREIATVALFLASDLSSYVTGATIDVNGAMRVL